MHLKISSAKWRPFCLGGGELISVRHFYCPTSLYSPIPYLIITLLCPGPEGHNKVGQPRMISTNTPVDVFFSGLICFRAWWLVYSESSLGYSHRRKFRDILTYTFPYISCPGGNDNKQNQSHWIAWSIILDIFSWNGNNSLFKIA